MAARPLNTRPSRPPLFTFLAGGDSHRYLQKKKHNKQSILIFFSPSGSVLGSVFLQLTVKEIDGGRSVPMREDLLWSTMEKKKLKSVGDGRLGFCERELLRGRWRCSEREGEWRLSWLRGCVQGG